MQKQHMNMCSMAKNFVLQKLGSLNNEPALPSTSYLPATPSVVPSSSYIPSSETQPGKRDLFGFFDQIPPTVYSFTAKLCLYLQTYYPSTLVKLNLSSLKIDCRNQHLGLG